MLRGAYNLTWQALREYDPQPYRAGGQERYLCPFCGDLKPRDRAHRSFAVNPDTGAYYCHRCRARGKLRNADAPESSPVMRRRKRKPTRWTPAPPPEATQSLHTALRWHYVPLQGTQGAEYAQGRGIPPELAHSAGVRFCERFYDAPAVVFPFRTHTGELIALQGRFVGEHTPKVLSCGRVLAGVFSTPGAWEADPVAIAEAPFDALSLHLAGVPAFALGGTALRDWLCPLLAGRTVLLAFDADTAGDSAAQEWEAELRRFAVKPVRLRPSAGKDWNEQLQARGREWVAQAVQAVLAGVGAERKPDAVLCPQCGAQAEYFPSLADWVCTKCYTMLAGAHTLPPTPAPAGAGYGRCSRCGGALDVTREGTLFCAQCRWKA